MDDVFNDAFEKGKETAGQVAAEQVERAETVEQVAEQPEGREATESATTAQENGKHVPLAALEAERKGRQDWKEKAIRYEEELKNLREQRQQAPQQTTEQRQVDPLERMQQELVTQRFNMSEQMARDRYKDATDLEEMVMLCAEQAAKNPALQAQLAASPHPWDFAYKEGKRLKLMQDMGDNPDDFKAKIRAEILAELQGSGQATTATAPAAAPSATPLPQSLATARSSAGRTAPAFTGPTPIGSLFEN